MNRPMEMGRFLQDSFTTGRIGANVAGRGEFFFWNKGQQSRLFFQMPTSRKIEYFNLSNPDRLIHAARDIPDGHWFKIRKGRCVDRAILHRHDQRFP